jgi:enamine deaminase RidA (YjgF/YER057c/UK114 family)
MVSAERKKEILQDDELGRGFAALVRYGPYLFLSGSDGHRDPETEELDLSLIHKPIEQCHNAFGRVQRRLEKAGYSGDCVMRLLSYTSGQEWSLKRMATWPDHFGEVGHSRAIAWGAQAKMADFNAITASTMALTPDVERRVVLPQPEYGRSARLVEAGDFVYAFGIGGATNPYTKEEVLITEPDAFRRQHFNNFEMLRSYIERVPGTLSDFVRLDAGFRRNPDDAKAYREHTKQLFGGKIPFAHSALPLGELAQRMIQLGGIAAAPGVEKQINWSPHDPDIAETVSAGDLVFVSSLFGNRDPDSGELIRTLYGDPAGQAELLLRSLQAALRRAGTDLDSLLSLEVFLRNIYFQDEFFRIGKDVFGDNPPAICTTGAELEDGQEIVAIGVAAAR